MKSRFIVTHLGAWLHYAVPEILERNDALCHLFTDFYCKDQAIYKVLDLVASNIRSYTRLKDRRADLPEAKVSHFPLFGLVSPILLNRTKSAEAIYAHYNYTGPKFNQKIIKALESRNFGFDNIYTKTGAGLELMKKYKGRARLVHDQIILPHRRIREIIEVEQRKYPDWGIGEDFGPQYRLYEAREIEEMQFADLILCGSDFVREGIISIDQDLAPKIKVVPYGASYNRNAIRPREEYSGQRKLRVFVAGKLGLRKGYQYVLEAAKALHSKVEFRIAGNYAEVALPKIKELGEYTELLGIVTGADMPDYYNWADVFLLPSLCEGSAVVIYEALQFGLPIITTPNAGSIVTDGVEGLIVGAGNSEEIINGLNYLMNYPEQLAFFAKNARLKSADASVDAYERNFLDAVF